MTWTEPSKTNWREWPAGAKQKLLHRLQEQQSRAASLNENLPPFGDWLETVTPSWEWEWEYLRLIREKLQQVTDGKLKRLMIFLPPRHGKSEMSTIRYPVWRMERQPTCRVAVGCYNQTFAERFGRKARRIAQARGLSISSERSAAKEWELDAGGVFRACGVGNPPTGEGFDLLVIDDPVKSREEADSEAYRERVWEWYTDDLYTRQEPDCAIILIMTRWHEDDLAGRLIREMEDGGERWESIRLPALAEAEDPLGRAVGEALCPERYDEETLAAIQRVQGASFDALYQQNPTPKSGSFFLVENFRIVDVAPQMLRRVRAWDLASTEGGGDWTAGVLMGKTPDGTFYVLDVARGQWGPDRADKQVLLAAGLDGRLVSIRGAEDPGSAGKRDAKAWVRMLAGYPVSTERVSGPKEARARSFASQVNAGNVRLVRGEWNRAFVEELRQFPRGAHDDQVDAAADAFAELAIPPMGSPSAGGTRETLDPRQAGRLVPGRR